MDYCSEMFLGWTELDGSPFSTMSEKSKSLANDGESEPFGIKIALQHFYAHFFFSSLACFFTNIYFCLGVQDLPQYEATKAYMPKALDELSLQQAELVIVLQEVEGKCGSVPKWRKFHIPSPMDVFFFWFSKLLTK